MHRAYIEVSYATNTRVGEEPSTHGPKNSYPCFSCAVTTGALDFEPAIVAVGGFSALESLVLFLSRRYVALLI